MKLYALNFIERERPVADDIITLQAEARAYTVIEERDDGTLVVEQDEIRYTKSKQFTALELATFAGDPHELIAQTKEQLATDVIRTMARGES